MTGPYVAGSPRSRHTMRVVPVDTVCFAGVEEIKKAMLPLIAKHFPTDVTAEGAVAAGGGDGKEDAAAAVKVNPKP